jgi:predicted DNA-binding transcriptional regulator AlpA
MLQPAITAAHTPDDMLTPAEVAKITRLTKRTLADKRWRGTGPPYQKLGKSRSAHVRYRRGDVAEWMNGPHLEGVD